jgi:hypothetical protein
MAYYEDPYPIISLEESVKHGERKSMHETTSNVSFNYRVPLGSGYDAIDCSVNLGSTFSSQT